MTHQRHADVVDNGVAVGQGGGVQVAGVSLGLTLAKVVDTTVESISNSVQVGVVGDHSAVGVGHQAGLSLSLTKVVDTAVVESISNSVQVGVVGDHSAVGVGHQAGVSLGLTLANVVDTAVVDKAAVGEAAVVVSLGSQMGVGGGQVGPIVRHLGPVGVGHQRPAHTGSQAQDNQRNH